MSGKAVRETLAALGVIASLVFVGMEIRQNTAAVQSGTIQAVTDQSIQALTVLQDNDDLRTAYFLAIADSTLDLGQRQQLDLFYSMAMRIQMNRFYQDQLGIIDRDILLELGGRGGAYFSPYFADFWGQQRATFPEDFAVWIEEQFDVAP
jgi:hypothetical protein